MGIEYLSSSDIRARTEDLKSCLQKPSWIVQREIRERVITDAIRERFGADAKILELGSAHGLVLRTLKERGFHDIIGVDIDDYLGVPELRPHLRTADLNTDAFPVEDASMDCVLAFEIFEHLENPWHFARECARVLRPGGLLVLSTPWGHTIWDKLRFLRSGNLVNFHSRNNHITFLTRDNFTRAFGLNFDLERRIFQHGYMAILPRRLRKMLPPHPLWSLKACSFMTRKAST